MRRPVAHPKQRPRPPAVVVRAARQGRVAGRQGPDDVPADGGRQVPQLFFARGGTRRGRVAGHRGRVALGGASALRAAELIYLGCGRRPRLWSIRRPFAGFAAAAQRVHERSDRSDFTDRGARARRSHRPILTGRAAYGELALVAGPRRGLAFAVDANAAAVVRNSSRRERALFTDGHARPEADRRHYCRTRPSRQRALWNRLAVRGAGGVYCGGRARRRTGRSASARRRGRTARSRGDDRRGER